MHIWILWTVFAAHHGTLERNYREAFASQAPCERVAAVMNATADRLYDWVCLPVSKNAN